MLHYVVGGTVLTYIGSNILNSLMEGTIYTLYSGAAFVKNGSESNKVIDMVKKEIAKLDIKVKLELVSILMDKLPDDNIAKTIENGLIELVFNIKSTVEWLDYEMEKHKGKWFSGYRTINFQDKLDELKNLIVILDGRINLLMVANK